MTDGSDARASHRTGEPPAVPAASPLTARSVIAARQAPEGPPAAVGITDRGRPAAPGRPAAELTIGTIEVTVIGGPEQTEARSAAAQAAAQTAVQAAADKAAAAQAARNAQMARPPRTAAPSAAGLRLAARRWYGMAQT